MTVDILFSPIKTLTACRSGMEDGRKRLRSSFLPGNFVEEILHP